VREEHFDRFRWRDPSRSGWARPIADGEPVLGWTPRRTDDAEAGRAAPHLSRRGTPGVKHQDARHDQLFRPIVPPKPVFAANGPHNVAQRPGKVLGAKNRTSCTALHTSCRWALEHSRCAVMNLDFVVLGFAKTETRRSVVSTHQGRKVALQVEPVCETSGVAASAGQNQAGTASRAKSLPNKQ